MGGPGSGRRKNFHKVNIPPGQSQLPRQWGGAIVGNSNSGSTAAVKTARPHPDENSWVAEFHDQAILADGEFPLERAAGYEDGVKTAVDAHRNWRKLTPAEKTAYIVKQAEDFKLAKEAAEAAKTRGYLVNPVTALKHMRIDAGQTIVALRTLFGIPWNVACREYGSLQAEIQTLKQNQRIVDDEGRVELEAQIQQLTNDLAASITDKSEVDNQLATATAELSKCRQAADISKEQQAQIQQLTNDLGLKEAAENTALNQAAELREIERSLRGNLEAANAKITAAANEKTTVDNQLATATAALSKCRQDVDNLKAQQAFHTIELATAKSDAELACAELRSSLITAHTEETVRIIGEADVLRAQLQEAHSTEISNLYAEGNQIIGQLTEDSTELHNLAAGFAKMLVDTSGNARLEQQRSIYRTRRELQKRALHYVAEIRQSHAQMSTRLVQRYTARIEKLDDENWELDGYLGAANGLIDQLRATITQRRGQINNLNATVAQRDQQISAKDRRIIELQQENQNLQNEISAKEKSHWSQLVRERSDHSAEVYSVKDTVEKTAQELEREYAAKSTALESKFRNIAQEYSAKTAALHQAHANLEAVNQQCYESAISNLLQDHSTEMSNVRQTVGAQLSNERSDYYSSRLRLLGEVADMLDVVTKFRDTNVDLERRITAAGKDKDAALQNLREDLSKQLQDQREGWREFGRTAILRGQHLRRRWSSGILLFPSVSAFRRRTGN